MNSLEVLNYLKGFHQFKGVYPKDLIPQEIPKNSGIVINTDLARDPGEHWVAIYLNKEGVATYFDSFGMTPMHKEIILFLDTISSKGWYYSTITFQSIWSDTCGMYCVFFLSNYFRGGDMENLKQIFNQSTNINDLYAKILYKTQT